jgi:hypothetical protein
LFHKIYFVLEVVVQNEAQINMIMMQRVLLLLVVGASAFVPMIMATKVLVTGAGGKTGSLVFKKLLQRPEYEPVGLVRTEKVSCRLLQHLQSAATLLQPGIHFLRIFRNMCSMYVYLA